MEKNFYQMKQRIKIKLNNKNGPNDGERERDLGDRKFRDKCDQLISFDEISFDQTTKTINKLRKVD